MSIDEPKNKFTITREPLRYCVAFIKKLKDSDGPGTFTLSQNFFENFPNEYLKNKILEIQEVAANYCCAGRVHGTSLSLKMSMHSKWIFYYLATVAIDGALASGLREESGEHRHENGLVIRPLENAASLSFLQALELPEKVQKKISQNLRKLKSRLNKKETLGAGEEPRIKLDTILNTFSKSRDPFLQVFLEQNVQVSAANALNILMVLKLVHQLFLESKKFKYSNAAALDYTNAFLYALSLPIPIPRGMADAYFNESDFELATTHRRGEPFSKPGLKEWGNLQQRYRDLFPGRRIELFGQWEPIEGLTLSESLQTEVAYKCATTIMRAHQYKFRYIEEILDHLLNAFRTSEGNGPLGDVIEYSNRTKTDNSKPASDSNIKKAG